MEGSIKGSMIGVIKGDTRSSDYSSLTIDFVGIVCILSLQTNTRNAHALTAGPCSGLGFRFAEISSRL